MVSVGIDGSVVCHVSAIQLVDTRKRHSHWNATVLSMACKDQDRRVFELDGSGVGARSKTAQVPREQQTKTTADHGLGGCELRGNAWI
jgi:5-methylcytosine-specific restriction endonuclease McrA